MKFVIRDDDLNYFSKPADIERWYADIFALDIPVGFSTVPFINPRGDAYPFGSLSEDREYPVSGNTELTEYVKSQTLIETLQHGTTHETKEGVFEYAGRVGLGETLRGREELEQAFGVAVSTFVPPHDWIGSAGVRSVEEAGMDIIRGRGAGLRNWIPRWEYLKIFFIMLAYKLRHAFKHKIPAYPYVLDFGLHKEVCSYRLEDEDVFDGLAYAEQKDGVFVVVTHLHFFTDKKKERLLQLIEKAREYGAEFAYPRELFKRNGGRGTTAER